MFCFWSGQLLWPQYSIGSSRQRSASELGSKPDQGPVRVLAAAEAQRKGDCWVERSARDAPEIATWPKLSWILKDFSIFLS